MAEVRYFLKLGDIAGESTDKDHPAEIEVHSFGWGAVQTEASGPGGGGGAGRAGKVEIDEVSYVATSGIASPPTFLACATGRHLPEAVITGRRTSAKGNSRDFLVIKLKEVTVTSYNQLADDGGLPEDEVTLSFREIELTVSNGTTTSVAGWDITTSSPA
jgi:type VI secretion system secreted protein Hcp